MKAQYFYHNAFITDLQIIKSEGLKPIQKGGTVDFAFVPTLVLDHGDEGILLRVKQNAASDWKNKNYGTHTSTKQTIQPDDIEVGQGDEWLPLLRYMA